MESYRKRLWTSLEGDNRTLLIPRHFYVSKIEFSSQLIVDLYMSSTVDEEGLSLS